MVIFGNETITVFNMVVDDDGKTTYIPHVVTGANLVETKGANRNNSGIDNADTARLFVELGDYVKPKEWQKMSTADKYTHYTFTPQDDFFVKGDLSDVVQGYGFFQKILEEYDSVYVVTTCDEYLNVLPHLEVYGK